jgi:hypothetical protein
MTMLYESVEPHIRGLQPHLQHNSRLADPLNPFTRAIAELTSKQKKTEDDHRRIADLEWEGGLYLDDDGRPCVPGFVLVGALYEAGKLVRKGPKVRAGVYCHGHFPLIHAGPRSLEALKADPEFRDTRIVRNPGKGGRVSRTRPKFPEWELKFALEFRPDIISRADVLHLTSLLCSFIGLSDDRRLGGGRAVLVAVDGRPYKAGAEAGKTGRESGTSNGKAALPALEAAGVR